jgi:pimeloyl-ACP methyl ester carboxylesterase
MDINGLISTKVVGQLFMAIFQSNVSRNWFRLAARSQETAKQLTNSTLETQQRGACFCLASALQKWFYETSIDPMGAKVAVPTLVLWGKADRTHRHSNPRGVLQHVAEGMVTVEEFEGIGHFSDFEQPDIFCDRVHQFLSREPSRL